MAALQSEIAQDKASCAVRQIRLARDHFRFNQRFLSALGMPVRRLPGEEGEKYIRLLDPNEQLHIEVQSVTHPSRVHLDIETDDIEAEVKRLEGLGARQIKRVKTWCVMEAPTGQRFCVVRPQSKHFAEHAQQWN